MTKTAEDKLDDKEINKPNSPTISPKTEQIKSIKPLTNCLKDMKGIINPKK